MFVVFPFARETLQITMLDDFDIAPAAEEEEGAAAGGSRNGRGKAKAGATNPNKTKDDKCLVPYCMERAANQKVWCCGHACSWTGFCAQCEEQGPAAMAELERIKRKGSEHEKGAAVGNFALKNPPDKKYQKKQLFDVVGYFKERYALTATAEREGEKPMTKAAFIAHCKWTLGLTEDEWESWWLELYDDPRTERDLKGFRGREQIWVQLGEDRERRRERGVKDAAQEKSKDMKGYSDHDLQVLHDHALRQKTSVADSFLTSGANAQSHALLKRDAVQAGLDQAPEKSEPEKPKRKRAKTFDPDRDAPKYHNTMGEELEKLGKKFDGVEDSFNKALEELKAMPEETKIADLALAGYIRKLQHRYQTFLKWKGDDIVVKLHNVHAEEGDVATPTLFPGSLASPLAEVASSLFLL